MIGNEVIQRQTGMTKSGRIRLRIADCLFQHEQILLDGRILDKAEFLTQERRIP